MSASSKNRILISVIAILLLANIALLYFFVFNGPGKRNSEPRLTELLQKEVGFSKEQIATVEKMKLDHKEKMKPLFDDLRSSKDSFYVLLNRNVPDSVIQLYLNSIGEKQKSLDMQVFLNFKELRKLCTPDQLPKFDTVVQKVIRKMTGRFRKSEKPGEEKK